ncbi:MAG: hypothetical protein QNJ19_15110 [Woeseiaceae bacterium]|nr:hypothetical protein [Woeseiaceae bacterium]
MKLRIKDNSIRFRLTRSEIDALNQSGVVSASTGFPGGRRLNYVVESSPASVTPAAFYSENTVSVRLPEAMVLALATTEQVSIDDQQVLVDGDKLRVIVEKDFACLTPREGEDESDMYPHPKAGESTC